MIDRILQTFYVNFDFIKVNEADKSHYLMNRNRITPSNVLLIENLLRYLCLSKNAVDPKFVDLLLGFLDNLDRI